MLRKYESVIIFDPELTEQDAETQANALVDYIKENGGAVHTKDVWGRRPLAYRIKKKDYGIYVLFIFDAPTGFNSVFDRQLRLQEKVLRHLIVHKDRYAPDISQAARDYASAPNAYAELGGYGESFGDVDGIDESIA